MSIVLVVDDSKITRDLHGFMLESSGYEVEYAENGAEALEKVIQTRYALIVTDINMPNMDGYEFTRHVRQMTEYSSCPIIIVSTEAEAEDKTRGLAAGANVYITKPVQMEELIAQVTLLLAA